MSVGAGAAELRGSTPADDCVADEGRAAEGDSDDRGANRFGIRLSDSELLPAPPLPDLFVARLRDDTLLPVRLSAFALPGAGWSARLLSATTFSLKESPSVDRSVD